jgi:hypothetical protein
MMIRKRLDAQIEASRYEYIKNTSEQTGQHMNTIADELIAIGIAVKRGEVIEQQSLPVIREIVTTELRKGLSAQRDALREDMALEFTNEIKAITRASDNRLAALIVKALRDANIGRRLMYTILAKAYGTTFAMQAYEDASQKAGRDLANRPSKGGEDES